MQYQYTRSADSQARGKAPQHLYKWQHSTSTVNDLVQWAYVDGLAFTPAIFDLDAELLPDQVIEGKEVKGERTHRNLRLWRGSQLIVLDVDEAPNLTLRNILDDPYIQAHAAAVFPSSSYTPHKLKVHILIPLTSILTDTGHYRTVGAAVASQLSFAVDTATLSPAQAVYGTVFTDPSMRDHVRTLDDGLCWINSSVTPVNPHGILAAIIESEGQSHTGDISWRVKNHFNAGSLLQAKVIIEALSFVLDPLWGEQDYRTRLITIMAAYHGCSHESVLQLFLDYSSPRWDDSGQKAGLEKWWAGHVHKQGGVTVATLFLQARERGWLQQSSVELQGAEQIDVEDLTDWLLNTPDLSTRLLLKSSTGTGKTQAAIALLKQMRNDRDQVNHAQIDQVNPVKAVFFAPSIKLCHALSASLTRAGVENILYIDGGRKTKDRDTLRRADVLVTTLQTFAVKAFAGKSDTVYDLVVMDECDELLSAFVRSGISRKIAQASHVDTTQARLGIEAVEHLFKTSGRVLMLDGTMTELSRYIADQWSNVPLGVYENVYTRDKADVEFYATLQTIRDSIVDDVSHGKRVVVACDTKAEAAIVEHLLVLTEAATPDKILRITGDTAADERVNTFFRDVEVGAAAYQVIIYNSAMGSGVSIVDTVPDTFYLISTYLSPRKLIQILNRYRRQDVVRVFVQPRESLYSTSAYERFQTLQHAARMDEKLTGIERVERSAAARVVSEASLIVATDEFEQNRSVRDFFINLVRQDGRYTSFHWEATTVHEEALKRVKDIIKELKVDIRSGWRSVTPIKRGESFPDGMTDHEAAKGLLHGYINELFPDCPEGALGLEDVEIARLATTYGKYRTMLKHWLNPERITKHTLDELRNSRKESVTYRLYLARVELLTQVSKLFPAANKTYSDEELEKRSSIFIDSVRQRESVFNLIAPNKAQLETLLEGEDAHNSIAKIILKTVGLSLKRQNGKRINGTEKRERTTRIKGLDDILNFVKLANLWKSDLPIDFNYETFTQYQKQLDKAAAAYNQLPNHGKDAVLDVLNAVDNSSFLFTVSAEQNKIFA